MPVIDRFGGLDRRAEKHGEGAMTARDTGSIPAFGGAWTRQKLEILKRYLDAYTTALKKQPFRLLYIDAFAGAGWTGIGDAIVDGSAELAATIRNKPFDKLIFVEKNAARCRNLERLRAKHPERNIELANTDANAFLANFRIDRRRWRGVLFLDPFSTEVEWSTIEKIAGFEALDTWILFPTMAIARMLPISKKPDDIDPKWAVKLTKVYGDQSWRELYRLQTMLFERDAVERSSGTEGLLAIYKRKLKSLFGNRFMSKSRTLRNARNSPLFELVFCVGNPAGIELAKRIAGHILKRF